MGHFFPHGTPHFKVPRMSHPLLWPIERWDVLLFSVSQQGELQRTGQFDSSHEQLSICISRVPMPYHDWRVPRATSKIWSGKCNEPIRIEHLWEWTSYKTTFRRTFGEVAMFTQKTCMYSKYTLASATMYVAASCRNPGKRLTKSSCAAVKFLCVTRTGTRHSYNFWENLVRT